MKHLETRIVSRKTPGDGRLEITKQTAQRIESLSPPFLLELHGAISEVNVGTMACTCRGADNPHVHYFLESEWLKSLKAADEVELLLDADTRTVSVRPAGSDDVAS